MAEETEGRVAIVTGVASGIGAETARGFAEASAKALVADYRDGLGLQTNGIIGRGRIAILEKTSAPGGTP